MVTTTELANKNITVYSINVGVEGIGSAAEELGEWAEEVSALKNETQVERKTHTRDQEENLRRSLAKGFFNFLPTQTSEQRRKEREKKRSDESMEDEPVVSVEGTIEGLKIGIPSFPILNNKHFGAEGRDTLAEKRVDEFPTNAKIKTAVGEIGKKDLQKLLEGEVIDKTLSKILALTAEKEGISYLGEKPPKNGKIMIVNGSWSNAFKNNTSAVDTNAAIRNQMRSQGWGRHQR